MKRITVSIVALLILLTRSYAQQWQGDAIIPMAPDAWSMIKYGGQSSPDLYTGTLHVSIPLYTYKDQDFVFPVNLEYTTNGFQPNRTTGPAGLGWTLNAGGVITREINGIPDESNRNGMYGHLYRNLNVYNADPLAENWIVQEDGIFHYAVGNTLYEGEPDVFSFSFLGHSGKFILIRKNNKIQPLFFNTEHPAGEYCLEIDDIHSMASITITTGDGMQYSFESLSADGVFTSIVIHYNNSIPPSSSTDIVSWYLTRITAPNGRTVDIEYSSPGYSSCCQPYSGWNSYYDSVLYYCEENPSMTGYESINPGNSNRGFRQCTTSYVIPNRIRVTDVGFDMRIFSSNRSVNEKMRRSSLDTLIDIPCCKKLDSIIIRNTQTEDTLKTVRFSFKEQFASGNPMLLLKTLYVSGEGLYRMDYCSEDAFPYQGTTSIDHWGYLNSASPAYSLSDLIPQVNVNIHSLEQTINTQTSMREPNPATAIKGCLNRLTYPTGGYTTYEYEGNTYSSILTRNHSSSYRPIVTEIGKDSLAGGLRIKCIKDYPISSPCLTRRYKYESGMHSSGILLRDPKYCCFFEAISDNGMLSHIMLMSMTSWCTFAYPVDAYDICYHSVREESSNGAVTEYEFSSMKDSLCLDHYPDNTYPIDSSLVIQENNALNAYMDPDSRHALRGKLVKKTCFASGSANPWYKEEYIYENKTATDYPYVSGVRRVYCLLYEKRFYLDNCIPISLKKTYYEGADSLKVVDTFLYNGLNQKIETCSRDYSMGTATLSRIQYLNDADTLGKVVYRTMKRKNLVALPIRTLEAYSSNTATPTESQYRLTEGCFYDYGLNGSLICLKNLKKSKIKRMVFSGFSFDSDLVTEASYSYNSQNRPIEIKNRAGRSTTFIWGYHGLYPIAKLENTTPLFISNLLGIDLNGNPLSGALTQDQESLLYNSMSMETNIYEWRPFVGIIRLCSPARISTYYGYDKSGRLNLIADDKGRPVMEYKYHVISE